MASLVLIMLIVLLVIYATWRLIEDVAGQTILITFEIFLCLFLAGGIIAKSSEQTDIIPIEKIYIINDELIINEKYIIHKSQVQIGKGPKNTISRTYFKKCRWTMTEIWALNIEGKDN